MSTKTLHFSVGEDAGKLVMEIAQEHLIYNLDVDKAIKTITDSLEGCPMDLALSLLSGDSVLLVDVKEQVFLLDTEGKKYSDFPKINMTEWCKNKTQEIKESGEGLVNALEQMLSKIRNKFVTKTYNYSEIIKFVAGDNDVIIESLMETEEVSELALLYKVVREYIERVRKYQYVIEWMQKSYSSKFKTKIIDDEYLEVLDEVYYNFDLLLNLDFSKIVKEDANLTAFLNATIEIDEIIEKGIEPVNILDNYSAGWLSPEGEFYGLQGEIANMLHNQIADALQEKGVIPKTEKTKFNNDENVYPDSWLEQHGWVRIHGNNIQFAGNLNEKIGKENVLITEKQIEIISDYITNCHACVIKVGWKREMQSIGMFMAIAMKNQSTMNKKWFDY